MLMIAAFSHQMEGLDVVVVWRYPAREGNIAEEWAKKKQRSWWCLRELFWCFQKPVSALHDIFILLCLILT